MSTLTLERTGFAPAPGATGFFRRKNKEAGTTVDRENAAAARAFMEDAELPQWEKDFIDRRMEMAQAARKENWKSLFAAGDRLAAAGNFSETDVMDEIKAHRGKK